MLAALRRFAGTWPARVFFVLLVGSFGLWGVAGLVGGSGTDPTAVATVGSQRVDPQELQDVLPPHAGADAAANGQHRRPDHRDAPWRHLPGVAATGGAGGVRGRGRRLNIQVPDEALRRATFDTKAFQGPNGQFDRATFQSVLRNNSYTEARYLKLLRTDLAQRQLVEAVRAGGYSPDLVNRLVFGFQGETRVADLVTLPFAAAPEPPAPTDEQLERQYDDNANEYRAPEYRRVKLVMLSPEGVAKDITVSDADARAFYDSHAAEFNKPETRAVQVVVAPDAGCGEGAGQCVADRGGLGCGAEAGGRRRRVRHRTGAKHPGRVFRPRPCRPGVCRQHRTPSRARCNAEGSWAVFRVTDVTGG